jgi:hypothetical protein
LASRSFTDHLVSLLADAEELDCGHRRLRTGRRGRQWGVGSLNRAAVVMCVSAWEAYIEELVKEALDAMRPAAGSPVGPFPALNASARGAVGRFNNPSVDNVRRLLSDTLGLLDVTSSWSWKNCTPQQARDRLAAAIEERHKIAHGVNPRPTVHNNYSRRLPAFFRHLGRCTDRAVRDHLVKTLGVPNPWPP